MATQVIKALKVLSIMHSNCEVTDSVSNNCKNDLWTETTNIWRLRSHCQNAASWK